MAQIKAIPYRFRRGDGSCQHTTPPLRRSNRTGDNSSLNAELAKSKDPAGHQTSGALVLLVASCTSYDRLRESLTVTKIDTSLRLGTSKEQRCFGDLGKIDGTV
jgi:hypothetical protein